MRLAPIPRRARALLAVLLGAALVALPACGGDDDPTVGGDGAASDGALSGLLRIDAGSCQEAGVTAGSSFRMVQPGGTVEGGPYVTNGDSPCGDKTWTPLAPGDEEGLRLGTFQPQPDPPFAEAGHGLASAIIVPQPWFAVAFAVATNEVDPQTGTTVDAPSLAVGPDGTLTGDLRAWGVAWNGQHFNQGSPKPDGSMPGATTSATGTLDEASGRFVIEWSSQIVGGPFNDFTGIWHLEGTFESEG